jgi:hypothetical protein
LTAPPTAFVTVSTSLLITDLSLSFMTASKVAVA